MERFAVALPTMTPEQREAALAKARESRLARSAMLAAVKKKDLSLADVLGRDDDIAKRTRVMQLLRAVPGYGPVLATGVLTSCGIDDKRRVGALSEQQRERLLAAVVA